MGAHHRLKRVRPPRKGGAAIKADAGPHQVKMEISAEKDATRISKARPCARKAGREPLHQCAEAGKLLPVLRMVPVVCTGEMAHDERDFQALCDRGIGSNICRILRANAEPVHARVEMKSSREVGTSLTPFGKLTHRIENRVKPRLCIKRSGTGEEPVQNIDIRFWQNAPKRQPLLLCGNEKDATAFGSQPPRHRLNAEPISVSVHDSG